MLRVIAEIAIGNASNAPAIGQNRCVNCVGVPYILAAKQHD
jgi:hypothetical protein